MELLVLSANATQVCNCKSLRDLQYRGHCTVLIHIMVCSHRLTLASGSLHHPPRSIENAYNRADADGTRTAPEL
eukprot:1752834-Rhodomonas_salina.1